MNAPLRHTARPVTVARPDPDTDSTVVPRFSIGTLVTDPAQYMAMRESFSAGGFTDAAAEYLYVDNTGPQQTGAFRALNALLNAARGPYVILCHQDVRLIEDGLARLETCLQELELLDPGWAVAGNAGGVAPGVLAVRITDPHGADQHRGDLPCRAMSLDENFLVVKRAARCGFSSDLDGFHFYGADLCLNAGVAGYTAYVIDFHLRHLSGGKKDASFDAAQNAFRRKWSHALAPRWIQTTCALVRLSPSRTPRVSARISERLYGAALRRLRRPPAAEAP